MNREGSVSVRKNLRGRKTSLNESDLQRIKELVQQRPDITLKEIVDTLGLKTCIETVRKALLKMGYSYKKKSLHASEQERSRCTGKKEKMGNEYIWYKSGVNINLTRLYAHAPKNKRAVDSAPLNKPVTTTVLSSSIRLDGTIVYTTYQGGTTSKRFYDYIKDNLIPSLKENDVVIMDNMSSHHSKIATELLDDKNIAYKYLPPYSPDLNPIEKIWSKMKVYLKNQKVRLADKLSYAVRSALETVCVSDCNDWFRSCGYLWNCYSITPFSHFYVQTIDYGVNKTSNLI